MIRSMLVLLSSALLFSSPAMAPYSVKPSFRVLAFYTDKGEPDHVVFAQQAIAFFTDVAKRHDFAFESTTDWDNLNPERLKECQLVMWLNDFPKAAKQRAAFEDYMNHGGRWLGFHVSAYNDEETHWPWFVQFLGGAVFYGNN